MCSMDTTASACGCLDGQMDKQERVLSITNGHKKIANKIIKNGETSMFPKNDC